eukprot:691938-Pelagomonas_calceolata.AAC.3
MHVDSGNTGVSSLLELMAKNPDSSSHYTPDPWGQSWVVVVWALLLPAHTLARVARESSSPQAWPVGACAECMSSQDMHVLT